MLMRVEDGHARPKLLSKAAVEKTAPDIRLDLAASVPLIARDSFVAETSNRIEQLNATVRLMSRDLGNIACRVADLEAIADQERRLQSFQKGDRRSKDAKLDELLRGCRDLKARLDRIEGRTAGDFHAYNSFEAVSRKLGELDGFRDEAKGLERTLKLKAWLLCAAVGASAVILVVATALAT